MTFLIQLFVLRPIKSFFRLPFFFLINYCYCVWPNTHPMLAHFYINFMLRVCEGEHLAKVFDIRYWLGYTHTRSQKYNLLAYSRTVTLFLSILIDWYLCSYTNTYKKEQNLIKINIFISIIFLAVTVDVDLY